ncbi:MAG: phospholipase D-like domain-containing protein [Chloroflexota bacterium]|nr:phospholipase D-like domain-containing protein [Chloroflexota bacterium]
MIGGFRRRGALIVIALAGIVLGTAGGSGATQARERLRTEQSSSGLGAPTSPLQIVVQPGAGVQPVLSLIKQARSSIRLEVYLLTSRDVVGALSAARQRGVKVRVLLEERPFGGSRYARLGYAALQAAGVPVRWANESAFTYTHEKSMEIDDRVAGIFTFNLTSSGLYHNREFGVIDSYPFDARTIGAIFDADWNRRGPRIADPVLAVSPVTSRRAFQVLIDTARHTLDLYAEEVDDAGIEAHLAGAERRGVHIRLITSQTSAGVDTLQRAGIRVKILPQPYIHAKAMVADGARIFIGSENISATSLDQNREMGIVTVDRRLARVIEQTFAIDWSSRGSTTGGNSSSQATPGPRSYGTLTVSVSLRPLSISLGDSLTIAVRTRPGAACQAHLLYPNGFASHTRSLRDSRTADGSGAVQWLSRIGTRSKGTGRVTVSCRLGNAAGSGSATYQIHP